MAFEIDSSIEIGRPLDDVWEAFCDIEAVPQWVESVHDIRNYSGSPLDMGSTWDQVMKFLGKEFSGEVQIVEFAPGQRVTQDFGGVVTGNMTAEFEDLGDATRLSLYFHVETGGFFGIAAPLMKRNMQKDVDGDLARFKAWLEG